LSLVLLLSVFVVNIHTLSLHKYCTFASFCVMSEIWRINTLTHRLL
jgi:hypothetical protein